MTARAGTGRTIAAVAIGNALEWYDFSVFVLFAPQIAAAFFPSDGAGGSGSGAGGGLVRALLVFGVGFVARPLGAVLIGWWGDRAGRKAALTLTFALMATGTLAIAAAPTHAAIGAAAPLLVLAGRILQGLSAGGEIGGASAFLVEHAPAGRKARVAAWLQASMAFSNILGALVALATRAAFDEATLAAWGWRVPFVVGLLIVPVGLWLRTTLTETPAFVAAHADNASTPAIGPLLRAQAANIARGFGLSVLWGVAVYVLIVFMPVYLQTALGFSARRALVAALAGNVVMIATCFVSGTLADRFGQRRVLAAGAAGLLVGTPLIMAMLVATPSLAVLVAADIGFCALVGLYSGAVPAVLAGLFPIPVRATSTSIAYNGAITIFAGFAPAIIAWMTGVGVGPMAPALYVSAAAVASLLALRTLPRRG